MLTTTQVAAALGVDRSHVRRLILSGKLAATKMGRDWLIDQSEVTRFQQTRRRAGRPRGGGARSGDAGGA
jgi:excisionase family DNA binding protein